MRILVTSDWHSPYFDARAFSQMLYACKDRKPDLIVLNGDLIDFYPISHYTRLPTRLMSLQQELDTTIQLLHILRQTCPKAEIVYLWGNHEERLLKFLCHAKELFPLRALDLRNLLELERFRIRLHTEPAYFLGETLVITHGTLSRKRGGYTAHAMMERYVGFSGVSGHTHRLAQVHKRLPTGTVLTWIEGGCLCQLQASYDPYPDWQHGIAYVEVDAYGKVKVMEAVPLRLESPALPVDLPAPMPAPMLTQEVLSCKQG